jgi:hypothetical protein
MGKERCGQEQQVEGRQAQGDVLPPVVGAGEGGDDDQQARSRDGHPRRDPEEGQAHPDRGQFRDQRDQVRAEQVRARDPPPERPEPLEDQLTEAPVGDGADTQSHVLDEDRGRERDHDERQEEAAPYIAPDAA